MARAFCSTASGQTELKLNNFSSTHIETLPGYLEGYGPVRHDGGRHHVSQGDELLLTDIDGLDVDVFGVASVISTRSAAFGQLSHFVEANPAFRWMRTIVSLDLVHSLEAGGVQVTVKPAVLLLQVHPVRGSL